MNKERLQFLLDRYKQIECSEAETEELNSWFDARNFGTEDFEDWIQEEGGTREVSATLFKDFEERIKPKKRTIRFNLLSAAAVFLLISIGSVLLLRDKFDLDKKEITKKICEIKPGINKAVLTLSDGSEVLLDSNGNGAVAVQNGVTIHQTGTANVSYDINQKGAKNGKTQYNTMTTPRGGRYNLTLADGTEVMLDAASSITYPVEFRGNQRSVKVKGQVYFKVVHNSKKPFFVSAKGQTIEDLGTTFNINAYEDNNDVRVALIEGDVNVRNIAQSVNLNPGQQAVVKQGSSAIVVKTANLDEVTAWTTGWFKFHNKTIREVMKEASRWYDVEIEFENNTDEKKIGGTISRYKNITELLDNLKIAGNINYKIIGRRVILTK